MRLVSVWFNEEGSTDDPMAAEWAEVTKLDDDGNILERRYMDFSSVRWGEPA
jgi:hypothetical protein